MKTGDAAGGPASAHSTMGPRLKTPQNGHVSIVRTIVLHSSCSGGRNNVGGVLVAGNLSDADIPDLEFRPHRFAALCTSGTLQRSGLRTRLAWFRVLTFVRAFSHSTVSFPFPARVSALVELKASKSAEGGDVGLHHTSCRQKLWQSSANSVNLRHYLAINVNL